MIWTLSPPRTTTPHEPPDTLTGRTAKATRSQRPAGVNQTRKEVKSVNKEFFKLPKAVKRAVWAALLAEWQKKKPATR